MEWRLRGDAAEPLGAGAPRGPVVATGLSPWKEVSTELLVESQLPHEHGNGRSPEGEQESRLLLAVPGGCRVSRMRRTPLQGRNACVTRVTRKVTQGLSAAGTAQLNAVAGPSAQQDSGAQRTNSSTDGEYRPTDYSSDSGCQTVPSFVFTIFPMPGNGKCSE